MGSIGSKFKPFASHFSSKRLLNDRQNSSRKWSCSPKPRLVAEIFAPHFVVEDETRNTLTLARREGL